MTEVVKTKPTKKVTPKPTEAKDSTVEMSPDQSKAVVPEKSDTLFEHISTSMPGRYITVRTDAMPILGVGCIVRSVCVTGDGSGAVDSVFLPGTKIVGEPGSRKIVKA